MAKVRHNRIRRACAYYFIFVALKSTCVSCYLSQISAVEWLDYTDSLAFLTASPIRRRQTIACDSVGRDTLL